MHLKVSSYPLAYVRLPSRQTIEATKPILDKLVNEGHLKMVTKLNKVLHVKY